MFEAEKRPMQRRKSLANIQALREDWKHRELGQKPPDEAVQADPSLIIKALQTILIEKPHSLFRGNGEL